MRLLNIPKPLDMDTMPLRGADTRYIYIARGTLGYRHGARTRTNNIVGIRQHDYKCSVTAARLYSIFSHWDVRAKFLGMAGRIGVVADQETN